MSYDADEERYTRQLEVSHAQGWHPEHDVEDCPRCTVERSGEGRTPESEGNNPMTCKHCGELIHTDDNGAGLSIWVHEFGSTVCYDDPPGSLEDSDTTYVAEPS